MHTHSQVFKKVEADAIQLGKDIGLPYQWLATKLIMVYTARIVIPGSSWQFRDGFVVDDTAETSPAPKFHLEFNMVTVETVNQDVLRIKKEVEGTIRELTRFKEVLAQGELLG